MIVLVAPVLAQDRWRSGDAPAAAGPNINVSLGYSFLSMAVPGARRTNINGVDASGVLDFRTHWGIMLDANYSHAGSILGAAHPAYVLTALGGPVFYPFERGGTRIFLHGLGGAGIVDGSVPVPKAPATFRQGWVGSGAYALGGGVERAIAGPFAIRFTGDYVRTNFVNYAGTMQPQGNLRMTVGLVFPSTRRNEPGR